MNKENETPLSEEEIKEKFRMLIKAHEGINNNVYFISTDSAAQSCADCYTQQTAAMQVEIDVLRELASDNQSEISYAHKALTSIPINGLDSDGIPGHGKRENLSLSQRIGILQSQHSEALKEVERLKYEFTKVLDGILLWQIDAGLRERIKAVKKNYESY